MIFSPRKIDILFPLWIMVLIYIGRVNSNFKGIIIDIEAIGDLFYGYSDSRRCEALLL